MPTPSPSAPAPTFPEALARRLRADAAAPLTTFYDDATGERTELSATTLANWVAKAASLLTDELGLERGDRVCLDLPTHWLGPVLLGACWSAGLAVVAPGQERAALVVTGPDHLETWAATGPAVVAASLLPWGAPFRAPLPDGVLDLGQVVGGQPDTFVALDPPDADDVAWQDEDGSLTQAEVLRTGGEVPRRVLTGTSPLSRRGIALFVGPLQRGGGTVWVRRAAGGATGWERRAATENAVLVDQPARS